MVGSEKKKKKGRRKREPTMRVLRMSDVGEGWGIKAEEQSLKLERDRNVKDRLPEYPGL